MPSVAAVAFARLAHAHVQGAATTSRGARRAPLASPECPLCTRPQKGRTWCRWCTKGKDRLGEPPPLGGPAWHAWVKGLRRTCEARLRVAGLSLVEARQALDAIFRGRGDVPAAAAEIARDYLARPCSVARYWRAIDVAVLRHQIHRRLRQLDYEPEESDRIAAAAAERIMAQREAAKAGATAPLFRERDIVELAAREEIQRQVAAGAAWGASRARVRIDVAEVEPRARLRIEVGGSHVEAEAEAEADQVVVERARRPHVAGGAR